jgi:hypothetical protein
MSLKLATTALGDIYKHDVSKFRNGKKLLHHL